MSRSLAGACALLLAVAACRNSPSPVTSTSASVGDANVTRTRMRGHDARGAAARDAVVRGDLERARSEARALAELRPEGDLVPTWRKDLDAMHAAAAQLAQATDLGSAGRALGGLARTCGDCHAMLGGPKVVASEAPETEVPDLAHVMRRHQWAATRLWDGLVAPSDQAWRAGARELREAPLEPASLPVGAEPAVATLAQSVHALGRKATVAASPIDRSAVYGELTATCASCHTLLGGGPR